MLSVLTAFHCLWSHPVFPHWGCREFECISKKRMQSLLLFFSSRSCICLARSHITCSPMGQNYPEGLLAVYHIIFIKYESLYLKTQFRILLNWFLYSVKPTQRLDEISISTGSLFRKLFSFYALITSYIPKQGHHNMVISSKSLFRIISNSNTLKNLSKNISKLVFLDFWWKKNLKTGVLSTLTNYYYYYYD